jgi:hypothetical protein
MLGLSWIAIAILLIALWLQFRRIKEIQKFKKRFGFLWDADLAPHCPACNTLLQWGDWIGTSGPGLLCQKCNKPRYLTDDNGTKISIQEARDQILKSQK